MKLSLATVLLFSSLGLVALGIALLARRYSRPALGVGLAGLLVLTTASTWLTWAGTGPAVDLRDKLAETARELDMARSEAGKLAGQLKLAEDRGSALARTAEEARSEVARLGGQLQRFAVDQSASTQRLAAADARIAELSRQLQITQAAPPAPPVSSPAASAQATPADAAQRERIAGLEQEIGRVKRELAAAQQLSARDKEAAARLDAELAAARAGPGQQAARDRETIASLNAELAAVRAGPKQQADRDKETIARLNTELAAARAGPGQQAARDRETIASLNAELAAVRAGPKQQADRDKDTIARLNTELAAARSETEALRRQARPAETQPTAASRAAAARVDPTTRSVPTGAAPATAPAATPAPDGAADEWRRRLAVRLSTPRYVTEPLRAQELVSGLRGGWYVVRLEQRGRALRFENRRFRKPDAAQDIVETARSLDRELIGPLRAAGRPVRLYVRGSADARTYTGTDEMPEKGRVIGYLPRGRDGRFAPEPREQRAGAVVRNRELPNLRADWVRETIGSELRSLAGQEIAILENPPAPGRERTVELVLYVGW